MVIASGWALSILLLAAAPCNLLQSQAERQSGERALEKKQFASASQMFQLAFEHCPSEHANLLELSQAEIGRKDFDAAISAAQQFLDLEPRSTAGQLALANAYFMAQRL